MEVYLDNAATTKMDKRVFNAIKPYFMEKYGNASSINYMGQSAAAALEKSREIVAKILHCEPEKIVFTSGATESNNLIIKGVMRANKDKGNHLIISAIEHASVLEPAKQLEKEGFKIDIAPITKEGQIDLEKLKKLIRKDTVLISVMTVNNEIGIIQPIEEITKIADEAGVLFHTDAVQAPPYIEINIEKSKIDYLSLSAHKFYGPKGVGIAYIGKKKIKPLLAGGGQEEELRGGTYNIPGIVGAAKALELAYKERDKHIKKVTELRDHMLKRITTEIKDTALNARLKYRVPGNLNIRFSQIEGEAILMDLSTKGICVSTGSACSSQKLTASHVLSAIGIKDFDLNSNIRFSLGKFTTKKEIDYCVDMLKQTVARLREFSPLKK